MTKLRRSLFPTLKLIDQSGWLGRPHGPKAFAIIPWYGGPYLSGHGTKEEAEAWLKKERYKASFTRRSWIRQD